MSATTKPVRVQLSRKKGWKMPPNTVSVARPTKFGNPFRVCEGRSAAEAVGAFGIWLSVDGCHADIPGRKARLLAALPSLRGKNLACWCPLDKPCHADVLLEIANRGIPMSANESKTPISERISADFPNLCFVGIGYTLAALRDDVRQLETENAELRAALTECIPILESMDTLRHIDPNFPALDKARALLARAGVKP